MRKIVKVTRRGQATIPAEIREQLGKKEGDKLAVEAIDHQIVFKPIPKLEDMCGIFGGEVDIAEIKKEIDKMREEY